MAAALGFFPVPGLPMIRAGDDLAGAITDALRRTGIAPADGDVICIAQKIVSKAEGRLIPLHNIEPGADAMRLARETEKDPRLVQLILDESTEVMRHRPGVLIVRHRLGFVCANAGIDQSNIEHENGECALLLPKDPDASATALRAQLLTGLGKSVGILITDSHNRPWRLGTIGTAIGVAGVGALDDRRGSTDIYGRELRVTLSNRADAVAAAATLLMGETTEKIPVVVARGVTPLEGADTAQAINRPLAEDLFR